MDIIYGVFKLVGFMLLGAFSVLLIINLIQTMKIFRMCVKSGGRRPLKRRFKAAFMNSTHTGPLNILKWVLWDLFHGKSYFKLFGIWAFTGYYGEGKSLGEVNFAFNLKHKHPEMNIKIYSNFDVKGQDGRIYSWEDILTLPPNTILLFDEIQSTFTSTKFKDFPLELLWKITQCRKQGLAIFCTSPVYTRMSIQLRESCDYVIDCKNVFHLDRWFKYTFFRADKYEAYHDSKGFLDALRKKDYIEFVYTLVARNIDYARYDTKQQIDRFDIVEEKPANVKGLSAAQLENTIYKKIIADIEKKYGLRSA